MICMSINAIYFYISFYYQQTGVEFFWKTQVQLRIFFQSGIVNMDWSKCCFIDMITTRLPSMTMYLAWEYV